MSLSKNEQMQHKICELKKRLNTYRPGGASKGVYDRKEVKFPEHLYIGLFGRTGCGKTSLINSLKYTVSGLSQEGQLLPVADHEKAGGHTLMRVVAPLENNVSVIDNRGVDDLTKYGTLNELQAQMDGKRGYTKKVDWEKPRCNDVIHKGYWKYSIGCAVFVFSAEDKLSQSTNGLHKAVHFLQEKQGRYPVAVITNIDKVDRELVEKLRSVLKVTGMSEIFEVANITQKKTDLEDPYQHNLLCLLCRCMTDGDEAAVFKHHREQRSLQEAKRIKIDVATGSAVITGSAGTGAAIGLIGGPVGVAIGAGIGTAVGGVLFLIKKITD